MKEVPVIEDNDAEWIARHSERKPTGTTKSLVANVVLFSYNRPRMLREAIANVLYQTYENLNLWVIDDGSDFDLEEVAQEFSDERLIIAQAPKIPLSERINPESTRFADNANYVLSQIPKEDNFVVYLCDDDLLHPDWLSICNEGLAESDYHILTGQTFYFYDGQDAFKQGIQGFPAEPLEGNIEDTTDFLVWWQLGGFAHLMTCYYDEAVEWKMGYGNKAHSWDVVYVKQLWKAHASYLLVNAPSVYRREHSNTLSEKLGRKKNGLYGGPPQELTQEAVSGLME